MENEFSVEQLTYEKSKDRLLAEKLEGQFVLIKGEEILGVYPTPGEAYAVGLAKFGNVPMFIRPILKEDMPFTAPALMLGILHAGLQ